MRPKELVMNEWQPIGGTSNDLHVVPLNDLREHAAASDCWCSPVQDVDEPLVWVHQSMDRREHTVEKGVRQ
jgi:hypothetical protein